MPVYLLRDGTRKTRGDLEGAWGDVEAVAFFAHEKPGEGLVRAGAFFVAARRREGLVEHGEGWVWPAPDPHPPFAPRAAAR